MDEHRTHTRGEERSAAVAARGETKSHASSGRRFLDGDLLYSFARGPSCPSNWFSVHSLTIIIIIFFSIDIYHLGDITSIFRPS